MRKTYCYKIHINNYVQYQYYQDEFDIKLFSALVENISSRFSSDSESILLQNH